MAVLLDAIDIKRKMYFEFENTPYHCMAAEVSTPTARGGQTLVRLRMRNLLTRSVFEKTFKANDKFKEPDLDTVDASYLYSDGEGSYFLDQESFETLQLAPSMMEDSLEFLLEGTVVQVEKYNGNPIGLQLPLHVDLLVSETEPGFKGDTATGTASKPATLETGLKVRVPAFVKQGDRVRIATETREFAGRA